MNYASTANIEEVMKFYNLGDRTFETDFKQMFSDIGLEWALRKCAAVKIQGRRIAQEQTEMPISHMEFIPLWQNIDHYKLTFKTLRCFL